jgi:hypothetical protein
MNIKKVKPKWNILIILSTKYNRVSNTSNVLVRTKLLYVDHKGWFVDEIEYLQGGIILDCLRRSDYLMTDNQFGFNNGALPIQRYASI